MGSGFSMPQVGDPREYLNTCWIVDTNLGIVNLLMVKRYVEDSDRLVYDWYSTDFRPPVAVLHSRSDCLASDLVHWMRTEEAKQISIEQAEALVALWSGGVDDY